MLLTSFLLINSPSNPRLRYVSISVEALHCSARTDSRVILLASNLDPGKNLRFQRLLPNGSKLYVFQIISKKLAINNKWHLSLYEAFQLLLLVNWIHKYELVSQIMLPQNQVFLVFVKVHKYQRLTIFEESLFFNNRHFWATIMSAGQNMATSLWKSS